MYRRTCIPSDFTVEKRQFHGDKTFDYHCKTKQTGTVWELFMDLIEQTRKYFLHYSVKLY